MFDIQSIVGEMEQGELNLLARREETNRQTYRAARANAVLATVVGLCALGALWFFVHRHLQLLARIAAATHRERELLEATLVSIGDAVIATDKQGVVTLMNAVAEKLTGWRESEAIGRSLGQIFHIINEETRQEAENPARRALSEGRIVGLANHTVLVAKDGTEWPLDDSAAPIKTASGQIEGAILVFREISERKRHEEQLIRQAVALEEADHRKDEFLATLAHELRNPLSPLSNALQLWPFVESNPAEVARLRGLMDRQVRQMTRLIDDLMDVSRIASGKVHLHRQRVDVATVIREAVETIKPLVEAAAQQLTLALPTYPLCVEGDVERLTQVFGNILNNAAKYSGRGGVIWLSAEEQDGKIVVKVRDNGPGIPPHMLKQIFDMFRQGDNSLERAHGGLGIGLTLVKRLVEEHGGTVEAASEGTGKGSEFIVTLPALADDAPDEPRGDVASHELRQLAAVPAHRILVVDDVTASAHTLAMMLRAIGQEVFEEYDGPSGVKSALAKNPGVAFIDIAMPGMSGYDVARRLRAEKPDMFLVALTGYGQEDDRRKSLEAGFNHHLVKPTSIAVLQRLLLTVPARTGTVVSADIECRSEFSA